MRFFLTLLIIGGFVAGWFILKQKSHEHEERFWTARCQIQLENFTDTGHSLNLTPDESAFFKLMLFLHQAEAAEVDVPQMVTEACHDLNMDDATTSLYVDALVDNLNIAKRLAIFDDPVNLMNLDHGETAEAQAPGWKGAKLAVAQIVPVQLSPETARALPNLVLVPTIVRDGWIGINGFTVDRAYLFERCHLMTQESMKRVIAASKSAAK